MSHSYLFLLCPFAISILLLAFLRTAAVTTGFCDCPSGRKKHREKIPLVGGPAIYIGCLYVALLLRPDDRVLLFFVLAAPLLVLGVLDDLLDLTFHIKIAVQVAVSLLMIYAADISILQIGNLIGYGPIELSGLTSVLFTTVCVVGVINAINMIDGADGLAGSLCLVSMVAIILLVAPHTTIDDYTLPLIICGGLVGFLFFNTGMLGPQNKVFMGDSGSMFLGFAIVWSLADLSQGEINNSLSPVAAGWVLGLPLIDAISVMVKRMSIGVSPFAAGRDHLHHKLIDIGFSVTGSVVVMVLFHILLVLIGLYINAAWLNEALAFWLFVALVVVYHFALPKVITGMFRLKSKLAFGNG